MNEVTESVDHPLDPAIVTLWYVRTAVPFISLLFATLVLAGIVSGPTWLLVPAVAVIGVVTTAMLPRARYRRTRWRLTHEAIEYRRGVVWRATTALPYFRIQHIDVHHGPLDRWLGLATLVVNTASVTVRLEGLSAQTAPQLRSHLLAMTTAAAAPQSVDDAV